MGNIKSDIKYSVPICQKAPNESCIYRNPLCTDSLLVTPHPDILTLQDAILKSMIQNSERKCLGTRYKINPNPSQNSTHNPPSAQNSNIVDATGMNQNQANSQSLLNQSYATEYSRTENQVRDRFDRIFQKDFGGAKTEFEWQERVKWIQKSTHLSYTEKVSMIETEEKKFKLQQAQLLQIKNSLGIKRQVQDGEYCWKTYGDLKNTVFNLATGMQWFQLAESCQEGERTLDLVGVWSRSREEYVILESTNFLFKVVTVPLPESANANDFSFILEDTQISTLFCGAGEMIKLYQMIKRDDDTQRVQLANLKTIVIFEDEIPLLMQHFFSDQLGMNILTFKMLLDKGATLPQPPIPRVSPHDIASFAYTIKEENGKPIAALLTHRNFVSYFATLWNISSVKPEPTDIYISYLPLHHIFEKSAIIAALYAGASIGFYSGSISTLVDDMVELKPTIFCSVPSFYNKLFNSIEEKYFKKVGFVQKWINEKALESKRTTYKQSGIADVSHPIYDNLIFNTIRNSLGGRLRLAFSSSAPLYPHVHQMLKLVFGIPIIEVYGCTQTTGPAFMTSSLDSTEGHVGGPTLNTEFKIKDVASMGYTTEDKDENGIEKIRGELYIRGPCVFDGYFRDEQETSKHIDKNGWYSTGDIVELRSNGSIKIIAQKKSIFKIPQGEYVCPEKLESIYQNCPSISDIFVYGSSYQKLLVAIVVPKKEFVDAFSKDNSFPQQSYADNYRNPLIIQQILNDIQLCARKERLYPFEVIQKVYIEITPFQILGLVTPKNQLKRQLAYQYFQQAIHSLNEFI